MAARRLVPVAARKLGLWAVCLLCAIPAHEASARCHSWRYFQTTKGPIPFLVPEGKGTETMCPEFTYVEPSPPPQLPGSPGKPPTTESCTVRRVAGYPMEPDGVGHAYIPLMIDKPRRMVIDTGGARSVLYESVVKELKLPTMDADEAARTNPYNVGQMVGFGGDESKTVAIAPSISFGSIKFANATFAVLADPRKPPLADNEIAGYLGPSHLMTFDIEFDFAARRFNLYSQNHCPLHAAYWSPWYRRVDFLPTMSGHIEIPMMLDGQPVMATLDSGAPVSSIDAKAAYRLFHLDKKSPDVEAKGHLAGRSDEDSAIYAHRFKSLSVEGVDIQNPKLMLTPDLMSDWTSTHPPVVILGFREMSMLHLFIAYSEDAIYLTTADAHCTPEDAVHKPGEEPTVCEPGHGILRE